MNAFSTLLASDPEFRTIRENIARRRLPLGVLGLSMTPKAHYIAALCASLDRKAVVVAPDEAAATRLRDDLLAMGLDAALYPRRDLTFRSEQSASRDYERARIGVLSRLLDDEPDAVVMSAQAAVQLTVPRQTLLERRARLAPGAEMDRDALAALLTRAGYVRSDLVESMGQFSVRGDLVDFFPPGSEEPVRVEFWGDTVDGVARFDPMSQRRGDVTGPVEITPAEEVMPDTQEALAAAIRKLSSGLRGKNAPVMKANLLKDADALDAGVRLGSCDKYLPLVYPEAETPLDYCLGRLLFVCDTNNVKAKLTDEANLFKEDLKMFTEQAVLCRGLDRYALDFGELTRAYEDMGAVYLDDFIRGSFDTPVKELVNVNARQNAPWEGSLQVLEDDLRPDVARGVTTVILAGTPKSAKTLWEDLTDDGFTCTLYGETPASFPAGGVSVLPGSLHYGVSYPGSRIKLVTMGRAGAAARKSGVVKKLKKPKNGLHSIDELNKGDYVVHQTHGIGRFDGIVAMEVDRIVKDYIKIIYAGNDILYVPVSQLDMVAKYIGPHEQTGASVKLNRLGSGDWTKTKSRVRSAVKDIAKELTKLYAERQNAPGYAFSPDIDMQSDFERRFEYDETEDQLTAIAEIKRDMERACPMDRLLCGDVGFGKTEVALRAAFKCVADGKQCAVLVPTTILAFQHYRTMTRRFEGFPVNIEMLSRFRTPQQQKAILSRLKGGTMDLVVGTHRIISKDVEFRDLGLLIVDEEQRFGVAQKEKLKQKFPNVDVLTLSATPIPRTLNMAMTGIRDMSVLEEPPTDRLPIQTYVLEHDMGILAAAMEKELRRGGQIYYLYNRVETIEEKVAEIRRFLPDARVGYGHGKMTEEQLSEVWRQLLDNEIDILVCTTIIETGVDVPNVNTLIIEDADRMGLAQLHQIRGRVGRSSRRAFAYLTFRRGKELSEVASQRLTAIRDFTEFGSGFKIALKDLEIRGAGAILGAQQHGHLEAVGYDMYIQMLREAVAAENGEGGEAAAEEPECLIDLKLEAHIPESYIDSIPQRLSMYRRIAEIRSPADAEDVYDELIDRFGDVPKAVQGLVTVSLIRNSAMKHGIHTVRQDGDSLLLFVNTLDKADVAKLSEAFPGRVRVSARTPAHIAVRLKRRDKVLEELRDIMNALGNP